MGENKIIDKIIKLLNTLIVNDKPSLMKCEDCNEELTLIHQMQCVVISQCRKCKNVDSNFHENFDDIKKIYK